MFWGKGESLGERGLNRWCSGSTRLSKGDRERGKVWEGLCGTVP